MNRRTLIAACLASLALSPTAWAQSFADQIVAQLRQQGYSNISVSNTWLGRTRIVAQSGDGSREIILDPRTGEILRDLWQGTGANSIIGGNSGDGHSGNDDESDDNESGGHSGGDDNNSGHGGGDDGGDNGGHGGGDNGGDDGGDDGDE